MFNINDEFPQAHSKEGLRANIVGSEVNIWISYMSPSQEEIELFQNAKIEIGVIYSCGVLVFAYKLGNNCWQDLYYSHAYSKVLGEKGDDIYIEPTIETLGEKEPLKLIMYFMDSEKKKIIGRRIFELTKEMKDEIIMGITKQRDLQDPLFSNISITSKVEYFKLIKDFFQDKPIEAVIKPLIKHKFY